MQVKSKHFCMCHNFFYIFSYPLINTKLSNTLFGNISLTIPFTVLFVSIFLLQFIINFILLSNLDFNDFYCFEVLQLKFMLNSQPNFDFRSRKKNPTYPKKHMIDPRTQNSTGMIDTKRSFS